MPWLAAKPASRIRRCSTSAIGYGLAGSPVVLYEKHVNSIFDKLGLAHLTGYSRRVLAVLRYLGG